MRRPSTLNLALGVVLGLGAPLGFLALRRIFSRRPSRTPADVDDGEGMATLYMALTTPVAFGLFGRILGRKQEQLRKTHQEIERLREEFAAVVAHDLRNPINNILLEIDLLLRKADEGIAPTPVETLHRLRRGARRLSEMVTDLLDAARIEAARLHLDRQPTSIAAAVTALIDAIKPGLGAHPVDVVVEGRPPEILADPLRLEQIVTNLVENAAKYSPDGAPIVVRVAPAGGGVALAVEDRGYGIPAEEMPRLFDRFYQTKRARQKKVGLGLGLYITKGLVEAHGGRITVASEPGRGSTFTVWLPSHGGDDPVPS